MIQQSDVLQLNGLIQPFITVFYHVSRPLALPQSMSLAGAGNPVRDLHGITASRILASQTGALQVLVSKNCKQSLNQGMPKIFTTGILSHGGRYWIIQLWSVRSVLGLVSSVSTKMGSGFSRSLTLDPGSVCRRCKMFSLKPTLNGILF